MGAGPVLVDHPAWYESSVYALLAALGLAMVVVDGLVTRRLWASDLYTREQKIAQTVLAWALPVLGAAIVYAAVRQRDDVPRLRSNPEGGDHESLWGNNHLDR
jgi:hypothetical protein